MQYKTMWRDTLRLTRGWQIELDGRPNQEYHIVMKRKPKKTPFDPDTQGIINMILDSLNQQRITMARLDDQLDLLLSYIQKRRKS